MSYEVHITLDIKEQYEKTALTNACPEGWSTSFIDGDPILGKGIKFYFTTHRKRYQDAHVSMLQLWNSLLDRGFKPIRRKIEEIVLDERFNS